jgi:hypothetical protein
MKDKRIIQVGAVLDGATRKKDGSVALRFVTNLELTTDEFMVIDTYRQSIGYLLFKENQFNEEDVPDEDVETDIAKSQSTQLRDALWVLYRARGGNSGDKDAWNTFYRRQMQSVKARVLEEVHKLEGK